MTTTEFAVDLSFQGRIVTVPHVTVATTGKELETMVRQALNLDSNVNNEDRVHLKLLYRGKRLPLDDDTAVFSTIPKKKPKVMVLQSRASTVKDLNSERSDPTIRGFDQEPSQHQRTKVVKKHWGSLTYESKEYKFCRFEACTWQSFGHRPTDQTPHDFEASDLLQKLATDPGIGAILQERELLVGTLGEMDPIDDRLMQKKKQTKGACLLGYNTNAGARIDIKLRTDDLQGFRPYPQLVSTLIHELSHNWVGEHNILFWTNYGQMYAEYLSTHKRLRSTLVNGTTTTEIAGLTPSTTSDVYAFVMKDLEREMLQHGLHPNMIADPIRQRCQELELQEASQGRRLGGGGGGSTTATSSSTSRNTSSTARERALAAAERRAREQNDDKDQRPKGT